MCMLVQTKSILRLHHIHNIPPCVYICIISCISICIKHDLQAYLPFSCAFCQTPRTMVQIDLPASARLALFLIFILNTMWIEAIFVGHNEVEDDCFVVCPDERWLLKRCIAMLCAAILDAPASRLMYVAGYGLGLG